MWRDVRSAEPHGTRLARALVNPAGVIGGDEVELADVKPTLRKHAAELLEGEADDVSQLLQVYTSND